MSTFTQFKADSMLDKEGKQAKIMIPTMVSKLINKQKIDTKLLKFFAFADCYKRWKDDRRPYYRLYPGVCDAFHKMNWEKLLELQFSELPYKQLEIQLPESHYIEIEDEKDVIVWKSLILCKMDLDEDMKKLGNIYKCIVNEDSVRGYGILFYGTKNGEEHNDIALLSEINPNELPIEIVRIIVGILALEHNPDLMKPIVLAADREKYEATGDSKYIDKAIRRGVHGFDVGKGIPTLEEMKALQEQAHLAGLHGQKSPHFRVQHLARRWTGKGRVNPKIVLVKESFVNWDLISKVPQGFHDNEETEET